jgi:hypothetical protein
MVEDAGSFHIDDEDQGTLKFEEVLHSGFKLDPQGRLFNRDRDAIVAKLTNCVKGYVVQEELVVGYLSCSHSLDH